MPASFELVDLRRDDDAIPRQVGRGGGRELEGGLPPAELDVPVVILAPRR
jgi:hypothetical protein